MKFKVQGVPEFQFTLTQAQIDLLMQCSATHYDSVCRQASNPNCAHGEHFIYTWWSCMRNSGNLNYAHTATWRQLDIACKVLEFPSGAKTPQQLTLRFAFSSVLGAAAKRLGNWHFEFTKEKNNEL